MENADLLDLVKLLKDHDVRAFRMGNITILFREQNVVKPAVSADASSGDDELDKLERLALELSGPGGLP